MLNNEIDNIFEKFWTKSLAERAEMRAEMRSQTRWLVGTVITVGIGLAGLMIALISLVQATH